MEDRAEDKVKIDYVQGVEGNSLYMNDTRVAGPKPWGGGPILTSWEISLDDLLYAFPELKTLQATNRQLAAAVVGLSQHLEPEFHYQERKKHAHAIAAAKQIMGGE